MQATGPEAAAFTWAANKLFAVFGFMFCQNNVKINQLLRGRLGLFTAEQKSVEDINLNISHAWGTPHKENKLAHPCISWGRYEASDRRSCPGKCVEVSSQ